jgi:ribosomal-protein-alanine N-acetyltransferase
MRGALHLEGKKVILDSFTYEDAETLVRWRSDIDVTRFFLNTNPITMESHLKWFAGYLEDEGRVDFVITAKDTSERIGTCGIKNMSGGHPEISYAIGEKEYRGKGYAKDAILTLLDYIKNTLGLNVAEAGIHVGNIASQRLAESAGFRPHSKMPGRDDFMIYRKDL